MKRHVKHYVIFKDNENLKQAYNKFKAVIAVLMRKIPSYALYFYDDDKMSIRTLDEADSWIFTLDSNMDDSIEEGESVKFLNGYDLLVDMNRKFFKEANNASNEA